MKKIDFNDVNVKEELLNIVHEIIGLNLEKTRTYIKINEDGELDLENNFTKHPQSHFPLVTIEEAKKYLKVDISDIRPNNEYIESKMNINYDDEEYEESPEYQKEYKEIYDELIEDEIEYVVQCINEEVECYNYNLQFQD